MKQFLTILLASLPILLYSTHTLALGCVAVSADVQVAVRDKDSPPPIQNSDSTHIQGKNCYANKAVVVNKQIAIAPEVPLQSSQTTIVQDTPAGQNPFEGTPVPSDTANVSKHIAIQVDIPVPYNKMKKLKHKWEKIDY